MLLYSYFRTRGQGCDFFKKGNIKSKKAKVREKSGEGWIKIYKIGYFLTLFEKGAHLVAIIALRRDLQKDPDIFFHLTKK